MVSVELRLCNNLGLSPTIALGYSGSDAEGEGTERNTEKGSDMANKASL